jgi:iron complex outermembrane receptor protein
MTRSRRRKLMRAAVKHRTLIRTGVPVASALLASVPVAYAQEAPGGGLQEVVVTAQKRTENLQDVPLSIQALNTEKLEQLHITDIDDYVKFLSGVTTVKGLGQGGTGIGTTHVYMRGVVSGQDGNHSASQPSVGTYIDELPVTTVDGTPDIHVYDIARIEVLEGPQGTLYGASSEAGTIRIITNKPDPTKFSAGYNLSGNSVDHGGVGWVGEGYVNFPLSPVAAIRLVAWDEHDAGYIKNVAGTNVNAGIVNGVRTFTVPGIAGTPVSSINNSSTLDNQYNTVTTEGGRAAVLLNLGDNWTITPQFLGQRQSSNGLFAFDPGVGDLQVVHFGPEGSHDSFTQSSLTVEGKFSNFDLVYAGGWFDRNEHTIADYSDYTWFYDKYFGSGCNWVTQAGAASLTPSNSFCGASFPPGSYAEPQEVVFTNGHYTKWSNELRLSTPQDWTVHGIVGLFAERQVHEIWEQYVIPGLNGNPYTQNPQGLAPSLSIPGVYGNSVWLTDEERVDRDKAGFGQATWDITHSWSLTGGIRFYEYKNSIQGFYGYSSPYMQIIGAHSGQDACGVPGVGGQPNFQPFHGAPCTNLNTTISDTGRTYRGTLSYKVDTDKLTYFTYSTGFRPGGVNRVFDKLINAIYPPYKADFLTNWEIGWKTQWDNRRLRWNGALFLENWDNFQFLFLGPNSVTVVQNAASAQIKGLETDLEWAATPNLLLSGSATYLHAVTTTDYCGPSLATSCPGQVNGYRFTVQSGFTQPSIVAPSGPEAPAGTPLPVVPKVKLNLVARYAFPLASWQGFVQAAGMYQTSTEPLLRLVDQMGLGSIPAYALFDLSSGVEKNGLSVQLALTNVADKRAQLTRYVECATTTCTQPYIIPTQPRTIVLKVGQKF